MKFICDFHIHSHYSIATSKNLIPEYLDYWARLKGIKVVGCGDFTHPGWLKELKEKLEPAEPGLFRLKDEYKQDRTLQTPFFSDNEVRFILTAEISNIYKKNEKVRKVHNLLFAPDFETVEKIQNELTRIGGNITSDGRPILGLDSRNLLEISLNCSERVFFVPAHIWTPWFSALGDKSGFNTIEECFDDLSGHIYAVETGLSSDPPMNWICSFLDKYTLISNSDAHSPEKIGREANLFDTELSYDSITSALKSSDPKQFLGTIEFFPQEGKYHYDGHRKCKIIWDPVETLKNNGICPVCEKKITVGVMNRVMQLSDRENLTLRKNRLPFYSLISLKEILSEIAGVGPNSKRVSHLYHSLLKKTGPEIKLLMDIPIEEIKTYAMEELSEAIRRMRDREVFIKEGFDGEYGQIKVFEKNEIKASISQKYLFSEVIKEKQQKRECRKMLSFDLVEYRQLKKSRKQITENQKRKVFKELNPEQQKAVNHFLGPALIIAGPGTGKTQILTHRVANLIQNKNIAPENILGITFTNKAANEMKERLKNLLNNKNTYSKLQISTFHALGYSILKKYYKIFKREDIFFIIDEHEKKQILTHFCICEKNQVKDVSNNITHKKQNLKEIEKIEDHDFRKIFKQYENTLMDLNSFDLDDLISLPVKLLLNYPEIRSFYRKKFQWVLIDEYQDINFSQYQLIRTLMPEQGSNLCVIGDPDQAIYGFRGADITFIKKFIDDYPKSSIFKLKKSYRCTDCILKASKEVIQSEDLKENPLIGIQKGVKIKITKNSSDKSEAEFIARTIEEMIGGLRFFSMDSQITTGDKYVEIESLSDFAVLCRLSAQMDVIQEAFNNHSIPYQKIGDIPFFKIEPIRSIIDLLKLIANPKNIFLKNKLIEKKITDLHKLIEFLKRTAKQNSVKDTITAIIDDYFTNEKSKNKKPFEKLLNIAENFNNDLERFIKFVALGTSIDIYRPDMENVTLMTIHSAKGLEFKCVFIAGCENRLLPYSLYKGHESDFEEERRLLYVGMTRAKKFLFLSHAEKRFILGSEYNLERSPFLNSIERGLIELSTSKFKKKKKKDDLQLKLFDLK